MALISSQAQICKLIPQQPPFVLVDTLIEYGADRIVAAFNIPQQQVLVATTAAPTEAGVIEDFARTVASQHGYGYFTRDRSPPVASFASLTDFAVHRRPRAGQHLSTTTHILQRMFGVTAVRGE